MPRDPKNILLNSYYIAGLTKDSIYLGNFTTPYKLLAIDYQFQNSFTSTINWSKNLKVSKGATITVDSLFVYLRDGMEAISYKTLLKNKNEIFIEKTLPFTAFANVGKQTAIYRSINLRKENVLIVQHGELKGVKSNPNLLQKQGDGIFSTDGMLFPIPKSDKIVYMYHYRNQFLCIDTDLNKIYTGKTIDTINHAHISVTSIKSDHSTTLSSPPLLVNRTGCSNGEYIFINSALIANNENHNLLNKAEIIDVYQVENGKYKFSFYLPHFAGKKVNDFKVYGKNLVAIYDHYLMVYKLNFD